MSLKKEGFKKLGHIEKYAINQVTPACIQDMWGSTTELAVIRTVNGLDVIEDACPHQGVAFTERGCVNDENQLVCTWHNWHFNLPNGATAELPGVQLQGLETRIEDDYLWVKPDKKDEF